jgi:hypothetical protein
LYTDNGSVYLPSIRIGDKLNLGGVQFDVLQVDLNFGTLTLGADGNCAFSKTSFSNPEYLQVGWGGSTLNNTIYYDDDNVIRPPITMPLNVANSTMQDTYKYRMYAGASDSRIYLLLDNSTYFTSEFFGYDGVRFLGTDTCETVYLASCKTKKQYYWPDLAEFGNSPSDTAFLTAHFNAGNASGNWDNNALVYIDTATGNLIQFPNDQLSSYTSDVNFPNIGLYLNVRTDAKQYMQAAWTDYGAKAEITDDKTTATFTIQGTYPTEYSYTYFGTDYALKSTDNAASVEFRKNIGSGQLPFLANSAKSYRYNGTTYETVVKETIGIEADARFDKDQDVKDLVVYMKDAGDFNYVLNMGTGIPCWESTSAPWTKFTDGDNDNVMIPFLGSEYTVQEADCISATKKVTLVKEQAKTTYSEGEWIKGLEGAGKYAGQEMDIKVGQLTQSSGTGTYSMVFELYDAQGMLVHSLDPVSEGIYLNETFVDSEGNYALKTVVYVDSIRFSLVGGGGGGAAT